MSYRNNSANLRHSSLGLGSVGLAFLILLAKSYLFTRELDPSRGHIVTHLLGSIGFIAAALSISFLFKSGKRKIYLIGLNILVSVLIWQDLLLYRHFTDVFTFKTLPYAWSYLFEESSLYKVLRPQDILLFIDLLYLAINGYRLRRFNKRWRGKNISLHTNEKKVSFLFKIMPLVLALSFLGFGFWAQYYVYKNLEEDQPGITKTFYSKVYINQSIGNLEFKVLDVIRTYKNYTSMQKITSTEEAELKQWYLEDRPNNQQGPLFGIAKGKNVISIQVESLQEYVIGRKINGQEITPNLNRLLKDSLYFNRYYPETWTGGTSDATFTSNVSLYPTSKGSANMDYPMNNYVTLAKVLEDKGYKSIAFQADQPGFWNIDLMYRSMGFARILDKDDFEHDLDIGMGLADHSMFRQSIEYLKGVRQPFYAFMVTLSSHYPYKILEEHKTIDVGEFKGTEFGDYLESVNYTDRAIGDFLKELETNGLLNNSIVSIFGDHHAAFEKDDKTLKKFLEYEGDIPDYNWIRLQNVPLILHLPGTEYKGINSRVGGQVDLFPTLLGLLGKDSTEYPLLGQDLLNSKGEGFAVSRNGYAVTDKNVFNLSSQKAYSLDTGSEEAWEQEKVERYNRYLKFTDLIIKGDLQRELDKQ